MCTILNERQAMVCDIAIAKVKEVVAQEFGTGVRFTVVDGEGTKVEANSEIELERFNTVLREAIQKADSASTSA